MNIATISKKAQALRRQHPNMSWHAAQKAAGKALKGGGGHHHKSHAASGTRKVKKRSVSGIGSTATASVGKTRKKSKKKGWFGSTQATQNKIITIIELGAGMAAGVVVNHMVIRPIEHKIIEHFQHPYVRKAMPWGEVALGGIAWLMAPWKFVKNMGLGIAAGGVDGIIHQTRFAMPSPGQTIHGVGDYTRVMLPVAGTVEEMISGLIQEDHRVVRTPVVGETGVGDTSIIYDHKGPVHTPVVSGRYRILNNTPTVAGMDDDDDEILFRANRFKRA